MQRHGTRFTDMPELPEVETIRRELKRAIVGKTILSPIVYYPKMIKGNPDSYVRECNRRTIKDIDRKGKFLLLDLDDGRRLLFHLRMEGKLYVVPKNNHSTSHLSLFFPFEEEDYGLAFYDVRKFGITMLLEKGESGPIALLGKEPSEIDDPMYLLQRFHSSFKPIKELLLDQTIIAGIGNIYASEILFRSKVSPFRKGKDITPEECNRILEESKTVLEEAIVHNGSTIRTYQASQKIHGSFQEFLKAYGHTDTCSSCHLFKIQKIMLGQRGTYFCPKCQHTGITLGITGKIGSGKSLATSFFKEDGFLTLSADDIVHNLYQDKDFLLKLKQKFPKVFFRGKLSKERITEFLQEDRKFKRSYESFLFAQVRKRIEEFIIDHDGMDKAIEVPLLFDAHMEDLFTYLVGVETKFQEEHLRERGDRNIETRIKFNNLNSYDGNRNRLDYILHADSTKEYLKKQVDDLIDSIKEKLS